MLLWRNKKKKRPNLADSFTTVMKFPPEVKTIEQKIKYVLWCKVAPLDDIELMLRTGLPTREIGKTLNTLIAKGHVVTVEDSIPSCNGVPERLYKLPIRKL